MNDFAGNWVENCLMSEGGDGLKNKAKTDVIF
jgi:hypothetical protein